MILTLLESQLTEFEEGVKHIRQSNSLNPNSLPTNYFAVRSHLFSFFLFFHSLTMNLNCHNPLRVQRPWSEAPERRLLADGKELSSSN